MDKVHVRDLLYKTHEEIIADKTKYLVMFDDGIEFPMHHSHVILSWPYWALTRHYSEIKCSSKLAYNYNRVVSDGQHIDMCSEAVKLSRDFDGVDKEDIWALVYGSIYNKAYNYACDFLPIYANTIDYMTINELLDDPDIKAARDNLDDTAEGVQIAYDIITKVIMSDRYPMNGIVIEIKNKSIKIDQVLQMIIRGRTTEVNSMIFDNPIRGGFGTGFNKLADYAKEMTSATKSFVYNDGFIADSEYFNRKMQLLSSGITHLVKGDCGTTELLKITVPQGNDGLVFLDRAIGSYRETSKGKMVLIEEVDEKLLGKVILLRTTLSCKCLSEQGVCEKCYGDLSYNIADIDSPGNTSCIAITEGASQGILSVKHLDFINWIFKVLLQPLQQRYFATSIVPSDSNKIYLNPSLNTKQDIRIRVARNEVPNLAKLEYTHYSDMKDLDIGDVSKITKYWVDIYSPDEEAVCVVSDEFSGLYSGVPASFSVEFLLYLKHNRHYIMEEDERFVSFSLTGYNENVESHSSRCIFEYQQRHESMPVYVENLENILRSAEQCRYKHVVEYDGSSSDGCADALLAIHSYLERKLPGTAISHIATILAVLRRNSRRDAGIPSGFSNPTVIFDKHDNLMEDRSLGPYLIYEKQGRIYTSPKTYITPHRCNSLLDSSIYIPDVE